MIAGREELGVFLEPLRKISGKRCLSPAKPILDQNKRHIKRKTNNPFLIYYQNTSTPQDNAHLPAFIGTGCAQAPGSNLGSSSAPDYGSRCFDLNLGAPNLEAPSPPEAGSDDPVHLCGLSPQGDTNLSFIDTLASKTENEVETDILGSITSFQSTSIPWPSSQDSASRLYSGASHFSTSYTSWTKPEAGHRVSDSCVPNSSILDKDFSIKPINRSRSVRRSKKSSVRFFKRDSSADTSKDIDDIEDLEFDGGLDELQHDDEGEEGGLHCGEQFKRSGTLMESPDLAYASLNPSADELTN